MKSILIITLLFSIFMMQKSNAFGDPSPQGLCKHFAIDSNNNSSTPVYYGDPLPNGYCPGPGEQLHDDDPNTLKHSTLECNTIIEFPIHFN